MRAMMCTTQTQQATKLSTHARSARIMAQEEVGIERCTTLECSILATQSGRVVSSSVCAPNEVWTTLLYHSLSFSCNVLSLVQ